MVNGSPEGVLEEFLNTIQQVPRFQRLWKTFTTYAVNSSNRVK